MDKELIPYVKAGSILKDVMEITPKVFLEYWKNNSNYYNIDEDLSAQDWNNLVDKFIKEDKNDKFEARSISEMITTMERIVENGAN